MRKQALFARTSVRVAAVLGLLFVASVAVAEEHVCKQSSKLIGACRKVHGDVLFSADALVVLALEGERMRLSVSAPPGSDWDMPHNVTSILDDDLHAYIAGDFEVCPVPVDIGFVDGAVCIESAANLEITYGDGRKVRKP